MYYKLHMRQHLFSKIEKFKVFCGFIFANDSYILFYLISFSMKTLVKLYVNRNIFEKMVSYVIQTEISVRLIMFLFLLLD